MPALFVRMRETAVVCWYYCFIQITIWQCVAPVPNILSTLKGTHNPVTSDMRHDIMCLDMTSYVCIAFLIVFMR